MMLGAYSETALSGVAAVNQIQFIYQQLLMALGDGLLYSAASTGGTAPDGTHEKIAAGAMRAGARSW